MKDDLILACVKILRRIARSLDRLDALLDKIEKEEQDELSELSREQGKVSGTD
jgi:hypothetical protein